MFTGIILGLGLLQKRQGSTLEIELPPAFRARLTRGASVAVNGVCLTVRELGERGFSADLSQETLARTTLGKLDPRTQVNLELPMLPDGRFDGHMVLGHVDSVGSVEALYREKDDWRFMFSYPPAFHRYVVEKGSIAVDGISLTPFQVTDETFQCAVIPQTFKMTNLQYRAVGDPVNLEFDVLAKYVERVMHRVH